MKKGRMEVLRSYWYKRYYFGFIRWLLQDSKGNGVYCDRCGNIANGVMEVKKRIGVFNIPLCKTHGLELFPNLTQAPFFVKYKKPINEPEVQECDARDDEQGTEAGNKKIDN